MTGIRQRLKHGELLVGQLVLEFFTPGLGPMLAACGLDFMIFDMEHGRCDIGLLEQMIASCRGSAIVPMVRVPDLNSSPLARVLDLGARGVMVPRVETREQTEEIVHALKYAPTGRRGVATGIAHDIYRPAGAEFFAQSNEEIPIIIQVETVRAFENLEAIVSVQGVDVAWIGHYDLTVSMGIPAQFDHPRLMQAMDDLVAACNRHGVAPGFLPPTPESAVHWIEKRISHDQPGQRYRSVSRWYAQVSRICYTGGLEKMKYFVRAFNRGTFWVPGPEVYWMEAWNQREEMNALIYLVRGGGQNILINTGPPRDLTIINQAWLEFFGYPEAQIVRNESQLPHNILRAQGLTADDISLVLVTPLQAYATANIHLFRKATIGISRRGWIEDFQAPFYHLHVPRHLRVPPDVNHYLQNEGWEKLRLLADEEEVLPGIRVFWAGVHHRSSMAIAIDTEKGTVIISDCFFKYGNIEHGRYLGVMESMIEADATWARIRKEADVFASIYDPEVFVRHADGIIA